MAEKETSLGIDLGRNSVKFVELYKDKQAVYLKDFAVAYTNFTGDETPAEIAVQLKQIIQTALREKKFNTTNVFITFSDPLIFNRFIKVPVTDVKKISQMISFEAVQQIPFPLDDVIWDYQVTHASPGEAEAMLIAIKKEVIQFTVDQLSDVLKNMEIIDINPLCLKRVFEFNENISSLDSCYAILNLGTKSSYIVILDRDIFWVRILPVGGETITLSLQREFNLDYETAEAYKQKAMISSKEIETDEFKKKVNEQIKLGYKKIIMEFKRSISFFKTHYPGKNVKYLSLIGGASKVLGIEELILENFSGIQYKQFDPFKSIIISDLVDKKILVENTHLLSEAVGAALRGIGDESSGINLIPSGILFEKRLKRDVKYYVLSAFFILMVFVTSYYFNSQIASIYQKRIDKYTSMIQEIKSIKVRSKRQKELIANIEKDLKTLYGLYKGRDYWLKILKSLEAFKSEDLWFTYIENVDSLEDYKTETMEPYIGNTVYDFEERNIASGKKHHMKDYLIIKGETCTDYKAIADFANKLKSMPFAVRDSVKVLYAKAPVDGIREFAIGLKIKKPYKF